MESKKLYCFISDENKRFYKAIQQPDGSYAISSNSQPFPIYWNPVNLLNTKMEFSTNSKYFALARSISYPLDFIKDGAAILRNFYFLGKGVEHKVYLTIIEWDGVRNVYVLSYYGKIDFSQKKEDPKQGMFTVSTIDDSAWGVLSQNDSVEYSIDCSAYNPKAIKVLYDGITLNNKATFQTVGAATVAIPHNSVYTLPFVMINQDGDSAGVILKSQTYTPFVGDNNTDGTGAAVNNNVQDSSQFFMHSSYAINGVRISGTFKYETSSLDTFDFGVKIYFYTSFRQKIMIVDRDQLVPAPGLPYNIPVRGQIYLVDFDFTINLAPSENVFLLCSMYGDIAKKLAITNIVENTVVSMTTISQPVTAYGLRPLDFFQQLVEKATNNRFTINSQWFTDNNKDIILSGDSIRGVSNSKIYSTFKDAFETFNAIYWMALRVIKGELWIERATEVYKDSSQIIDLGDIIDLELAPAEDYMFNQIAVGSPKQDYRHPSGRLEFNSTNTFSLPLLTVNKTMQAVSKFRLGCYDQQFLILDYQGASTQDNNGDKSVYVAQITDDKGYAVEDIETFVNVDVDGAILEPIIKTPLNSDFITYNHPTVTGVAPVGSVVNIYVDSTLDGYATADSNGNWTYNIVTALTAYLLGTYTGIHVIDATFGTESDPKTTVSVTIFDTYEVQTKITYPSEGENLYNNFPLIKGVAQQGTAVPITINGILLGTTTADGSCRWSTSSILSQGNNVIQAGPDSVNVVVDTHVDYPLITYVGSELDGFPMLNTLPLIRGVAMPGSVVTLWLNYVSYMALTAPMLPITLVADVNGNWSYQVVPVTYPDPLTGIPTVLAPIPNGTNIFSTSLVNHVVPINVIGYKLNRPSYSSILGVPDNTVFNTNFSPHRMLINRSPLVAAILSKQPSQSVYFQTADKNGSFTTTLAGITISEHADIPASFLGQPFAVLEYLIMKVKAGSSFADTLYNFNNGGLVKASFRGTDLFMLPIGSMKIDSITSNIQEWRLLVSTETTYQSLLNLYKQGITINLMKNSIYHSDYNALHFVTYNYSQPPQYNFSEIRDDWFSNRNSAWALNPDYIQKMQTTERIVDQIITNGVTGITLGVYRCSDALRIDVIPYNVVSPTPINPPDIVMEAIVDFSLYPEDQYFFVMYVGTTPVVISERIQTKVKWLNTILIDSSSSLNTTGCFFSTGFSTILRVEGLVKKLQPSIIDFVAAEEDGDTELLYSNVSNKRIIRFGDAYGLPDYLYLKVANALALDGLQVEGVAYTLSKDEKINPSDDVEAHPLYYYNVNLDLKINAKGGTFPGATDGSSNIQGVVLVVDATAFGMPTGSLISIGIDNAR